MNYTTYRGSCQDCYKNARINNALQHLSMPQGVHLVSGFTGPVCASGTSSGYIWADLHLRPDRDQTLRAAQNLLGYTLVYGFLDRLHSFQARHTSPGACSLQRICR